jgi:hypothetical protein
MNQRSNQENLLKRSDPIPSPSMESQHDPQKRLRTVLSGTRVKFIFLWLVAAIGAGFLTVNSQPTAIRMAVLNHLRAQPIPTRYIDLRFLLAGIETSRTGVDIWTTCIPCATAVGIPPADRPFNYPAAVIWLGRIFPARLTPDDANWMGPLIDCAFLLCAALLLVSSHPSQVLFSLALLVSPPILLGLERANYDLLIFSLVFVNLTLIDRWSNGLAYAGAFGLGMLKIFPVATIIALLRKTRKSLCWFAAVIAAELVFVVLSLKNFRALARNSGRGWQASYGYRVEFIALDKAITKYKGFPAHIAANLALPFLFAFCLATILIAWHNRDFLLSFLFKSGHKERAAFLAGAAIFSFSFVIGSNWNYRLIFLLFTVPHFFATLRDGEDRMQRVSRYLLGIVFAVFWLTWFGGNPLTATIESGLTWLLFGFFSATSMAALCSALLLQRNHSSVVAQT